MTPVLTTKAGNVRRCFWTETGKCGKILCCVQVQNTQCCLELWSWFCVIKAF